MEANKSQPKPSTCLSARRTFAQDSRYGTISDARISDARIADAGISDARIADARIFFSGIGETTYPLPQLESISARISYARIGCSNNIRSGPRSNSSAPSGCRSSLAGQLEGYGNSTIGIKGRFECREFVVNILPDSWWDENLVFCLSKST